MGNDISKILHSDTCNKCGVSYDYYVNEEHRSRKSCRLNNGKFEYHCFALTKYTTWWL